MIIKKNLNISIMEIFKFFLRTKIMFFDHFDIHRKYLLEYFKLYININTFDIYLCEMK